MAKDYKLDWNIITKLIFAFACIGTTYILIHQAKNLQINWIDENERRALIQKQQHELIIFADQILKNWDQNQTTETIKLLNADNYTFTANLVEFTNSNCSLQTPLIWCEPVFPDYQGVIIAFLDRSSFYYDISKKTLETELQNIKALSDKDKNLYKFPFKPVGLPQMTKSEYKQWKASKTDL